MKLTFTLIALFLCCLLNAQKAGTPDSSFGVDGKVFDTSFKQADCNAMALQPDGKILAGGYTDTLTNDLHGGFYIARYNSDGSIDESFGVNGKVIIRQIQGVIAYSPKTIIVQPDGKILSLGYFIPGKFYSHIGLIRFNEDGSLDNSFGTNGLVLTVISKWDDVLGGMVLQPDGKIVVAGNKQVAEYQPGPDFLLRYLPNGTPDQSFGDKGQVFTSFTSNVDPGAVVLQPDGKIVTGDEYSASTFQFQLTRYNTDGTLDETFAVNGIARLKAASGFLSELNSLVIQEDGKFVAAGRYDLFEPAMALARFNADGSIDSAFGNLGLGYTYLYSPDVYAIGKSVFVSRSKKIILTGFYSKSYAEQVAAVQYNENGIIDSSFGEYGIAAGSFTNKFGSDITSGLGLLQPDGKIIVSGCFFRDKNGFKYSVGLLRYKGDLTKKQIIVQKIKHYIQTHNAQATTLNNVSVYPNPAQNVLHVTGLSGNVKLTVVDLNGRIAASYELRAVSGLYDLNIASLHAGNYLLKIEMDGEVVTKQFVKE